MRLEFTDEEARQRDHQALPLGSEQEIADAFHRLSYDSARRNLSWHATRWRGVPIYKHPIDLWLYAELLHEVRPRTIIETGTAMGGSALYYADLLAMLGVRNYSVITVDVAPLNPRWPAHDRIFYVPQFDSKDWPPKGGRWAGGMQLQVPPRLEPPVLVVLDSDHAEAHVRVELDVYAPLVTPGSYLVVEDSNVGGHPVNVEHGPGPFEALADWLPAHPEYREDRARPAAQLLSYHTWLKRIE